MSAGAMGALQFPIAFEAVHLLMVFAAVAVVTAKVVFAAFAAFAVFAVFAVCGPDIDVEGFASAAATDVSGSRSADCLLAVLTADDSPWTYAVHGMVCCSFSQRPGGNVIRCWSRSLKMRRKICFG